MERRGSSCEGTGRRTAGDVTGDPEVAELPGEVRLSCTQFKHGRDRHDEEGDCEISQCQTDDELIGDGAQAPIHGDRCDHQAIASQRQQYDTQQHR